MSRHSKQHPKENPQNSPTKASNGTPVKITSEAPRGSPRKEEESDTKKLHTYRKPRINEVIGNVKRIEKKENTEKKEEKKIECNKLSSAEVRLWLIYKVLNVFNGLFFIIYLHVFMIIDFG